ncbi:hypothetical protein AP9108_35745 [Arthrospira sp. PCC 9108]|nr:hypothetical protein AP9108_35745 [Arthrospira sp. PCC 9108]
MNNHSINGKSHFPSLVPTIPITVGLLVVSAAFYPQGLATAQEQPGCFARTRSGRLINLNQICNFPEVVTPPVVLLSFPVQPPEFTKHPLFGDTKASQSYWLLLMIANRFQ